MVGGGEGRNEVGSRRAAPKPGKPSDARGPAVGDSNSSGSGSISSSSSKGS